MLLQQIDYIPLNCSSGVVGRVRVFPYKWALVKERSFKKDALNPLIIDYCTNPVVDYFDGAAFQSNFQPATFLLSPEFTIESKTEKKVKLLF